MRHYIPIISVDREDRAPEFLRIARAVMGDIERGRLRPSDALPGTRELAASLGVHRNTVIAAFRELGAQGWIYTEPARGTFVSKALPSPKPRAFSRVVSRGGMPERPGFDLRSPALTAPDPPLPKGMLSLSGGIPDVRLVPEKEIARALRRAMHTRQNLGYASAQGHLGLREELARMVSASRGLSATSEHIMVTRGSQMALDLVARALFAPGDLVVVESLGYRPAWDAFRLAGARLAAAPIDAHGVDVNAIEKLIERDGERIRAVYLTPHHQYPTTVTLSAGRRLSLLALAKKHRFAIIEDDYDHEFHYEGRPVLPLASADDGGVVVYIGTLSKVLAPGLRTGYVVGPPKLCEALAAIRKIADRQGDHVLEAALADLLDEGALERHIRRARRIYEARRAHFAAELARKLAGVLSFTLPAGGTAIWATVSPAVDVGAWVERARARGILLQDARKFAFDGKAKNALRLGFAQLDEREQKVAVDRMVAALS